MSAPGRVAAPVIALAAALLGSARGECQIPTVALDFTAANVNYADSFSGTSLAFSPSVHLDAPLSVFDAGLTYSSLAGSWTAQGGASGSLFTPRASGFMGEIAGRISGSSHEDGTRSSSFGGMARLHMLSDAQGVWIGGGGGRAWDGTTWRNLVQGEAGAWTSLPAGSLSIVVTPTRLGDTTRYVDTEASLSVFQNRAGLDLNAGVRTGSSLPITGGNNKSWGSATGAYWITNSVALLMSGGTYPVDFGQGFAGGRFIAAGVRLGSIPTKWKSRPTVAEPVASVGAPVSAIEPPVPTGAFAPGNLQVSPTPEGLTRLSILWPGATKVEVTGDFTDWIPLVLNRDAGGMWSAALRIPAGIHEMNVRADGGDWMVPPGLERKNDEFGGAVGLLIVRM